jgi:ceramide glucosyltransferase
LAEDFLMGKLAAAAGYGVALSSYVIEHHIGNSTLRQNVRHRLRWVRSTRRSRRLAYPGLLLTMPLPVALLACAAHPGWWPLLPFTLVVRCAAAYVVSERVLEAKVPWWLLPIEDLAGFFFWAAGFLGSTIIWQGRRYHLYPDGRFELLPSLRQAFPRHSPSAER